ncbi:MAG: PAS domain S-box protein [Pseudolabrys sp.]|nr:PAS domain S-box protein [Pseudolabrys sp.]MDP2294701.1 PAS domain S-box protein [Pseudolabrys sp.]
MQPTGRLADSKSDDGRYRLLIEAITDYAIYMLDPTGVVSSWNPGAQRFKGYDADEIIGKHFSQFYTEEDRATDLPARALETARREGKFESEGWRMRKDGTRFWAYVVIDPIRLRSGEVIGFAKITRDLTERKAAEETLRRSQEEFRLLVQGVTDYAIYLLDPSGHVSNWNVGAQRIKGYLPEEIIGKHFSQFYAEEDRAAGMPEKALEAVRRDGRFEHEGCRLRKDGSGFWAHVVIDAIRRDDGELLGYATVTRDITERRDAQEKLDKTREAFMQAQKMEAIGQLTGGVAHDFNNLLMAVLGSLELMRKRLPDDPKLLSLLENAVRGAERGAALTKRMLTFARRQELKQEPVDIPDLVRGMAELLQRSLGPAVSLETRFPPRLPPVSADANQLELALLNLTVNARDAMHYGGEIVIAANELTLENGDGRLKPGHYVHLRVSDTGTGMDEATLRRATEPFFTTKEPGKGTGLGLSMVHGLAEQFGGRFNLRSKVGEGTTAELWLPVAQAKANAPGRPRPGDSAAENALPLRIVAVDDDPLVLTNTVAMLEYLGHVCYAASSAQQALDILKSDDKIDLVITDQIMPKMTGLQLAKAIQSDRPNFPVILASGYAGLDQESAIKVPLLAKPFTLDQLAAQIVRLDVQPRGGGESALFPGSGPE